MHFKIELMRWLADWPKHNCNNKSCILLCITKVCYFILFDYFLFFIYLLFIYCIFFILFILFYLFFAFTHTHSLTRRAPERCATMKCVYTNWGRVTVVVTECLLTKFWSRRKPYKNHLVLYYISSRMNVKTTILIIQPDDILSVCNGIFSQYFNRKIRQLFALIYPFETIYWLIYCDRMRLSSGKMYVTGTIYNLYSSIKFHSVVYFA